MNKHFYRVIFNHALGLWQCVSELAKGKGKTKSAQLLTVATLLMLSGEVLSANEQYTDGKTHTFTDKLSLNGNVLVSNGTKLNSSNSIRVADNAQGSMVISGKDTNVSTTQFFYVGMGANGQLNLSDGATITSDEFSLGGTHNTVTNLTSTDSTIVAHQRASFGLNGESNTQLTNTSVNASTLSVGTTVGTTSKLNATGSQFNGDIFHIGESGQGNFNADSSKITVNQRFTIGSGHTATGVAKLNNSQVESKAETIIGWNGQGELTLDNKSTINAEHMVIGLAKTGVGKLTLNDSFLNATSFLGVGQEGKGELFLNGNPADPTVKNIGINTTKMTIGILENGNGQVTVNGTTPLIVQKDLVIGDEGVGTLTLNQNSIDTVGHTYVGNKVYLGGSHNIAFRPTTSNLDNISGTLILNDSTLQAEEFIVGNTGKGVLRLESKNSDDYRTGIYTNQITRNIDSKQSDIFINGGEIGILSSQHNLFDNFTEDNKIEIGEKGVIFDIPDRASSVFIDYTAVITGNGSFHKTGEGMLMLRESNKQFHGDLEVSRGLLLISGNHTMKDGENLAIHLTNWEDNNPNNVEYGQFEVTGTADISKGSLKVVADHIAKALITGTTPTGEFKDIVKAGILTGRFKDVTVLDNNGNPITTSLTADYTDEKDGRVHLSFNPQNPTTDPTTGNPTTGNPTTGNPTTGNPTTGNPTTGNPTTGNPTTGNPTTGNPTTGNPTTGNPTTGNPTTGNPTTGNPTTGNPTTGNPTTGNPTTGNPSVPSSVTTFTDAVKSQHNTSAENIAKVLDKAVATPANVLGETLKLTSSTLNQAQLSNYANQLQPLMLGTTGQLFNQNQAIFAQAVQEQTLSPSRHLWAKAIYKDGELKSSTAVLGVDDRHYGAIIGADTAITPKLNLGVALAYVDSQAKTHGIQQKMTSDHIQGLIYGNYQAGANTLLNFHAGIGQVDIHGERHINVPRLDALTTAQSNYKANTTQAGVGVQHRIGSEKKYVEPFAQFDYRQVTSKAYQETGSNMFNLNVDKQRHEALRWTAGVRANQPLTQNVAVTGLLSASIEQADNPTVYATFNQFSGEKFATTGQKLGQEIGTAGLGLRYYPTAMTEISGLYQGEWRKHYQNHGALLEFKMKF